MTTAMRRLLAVTLILVMLAEMRVLLLAQDVEPAGCSGAARIATWNIENFTTVSATPERIAALSSVWALINPDIIALQEIARPETLQILLDAVEAETGQRYAFALSETSSPSRRVGFAWNTATVEVIAAPQEHAELALSGSGLRPGFYGDFRVDDMDFTLYTLHLKAEMDDGSQIIREAQAVILADWIADRTDAADEDLIMLGDFNDRPDSDTLLPVSVELYFPTDRLPDDAYTYIGDDLDSLIDHIALSPASGAADTLCAVSIFQPESIDLSEDEFEALVSDHLPVISYFVPAVELAETTPEATPISATPEPAPFVQFRSSNGLYAVDVPQGWEVEEDSATSYFITGEDAISVQIEIVSFASQPELTPDSLPAEILNLFFSDAGYSAPTAYEVEGRDAAAIQDSDEIIITYFLDDQTFALVFVTATGSQREEYATPIAAIVDSFGFYVPEETAEATEAVDEAGEVSLPTGYVTQTVAVLGGAVTFSYPEAWYAETAAEYVYLDNFDQASAEGYADQALNVFIVIDPFYFVDFTGVDLSGATTPRELIDGLTGGSTEGTVREYTVFGSRVVELDLGYEDGAFYAIDSGGRLFLLISFTASGAYDRYRAEVDNIIGSLSFTPE
jgi:endonuclease/exonuclease/phosphatase family metal-dependent hydrolase